MSGPTQFTAEELNLILQALSKRVRGKFQGDLYSDIAREVFNVEEVSPELRTRVKRACFFELYMGGKINEE